MSSTESAFPMIYTERLQLRIFDPALPSDYDTVLAIYDSDFVRRTIGNPGIYTRDDIDARRVRFGLLRPKDSSDPTRPAAVLPSHPWHIVYLRGTDTVVGVISLLHRHPLPYPDMGWAVAEEYMNRGYATEAAKAALRWWTEEMRIDGIWAAAFDTNVGSHRVAQKVGFVDGGSIRLLLSDTVVKEARAFVQPKMGWCLDGVTIDVRPK
ncbi:uncharacterized protein A1O5_02622 [Cladophialophora psammophila CBS 110553]|uniref:N-acetyltransferase domain-containing protein n=1 Tax=Cladophialophora psammophila CBS 110553 TaxID=1182543 RepID=W9XBL7_9EURO|nr:uncharacterized protein A1O5_02622 [Cladophialophora psammophila CBS 110553]EXJ74326.1 hypothetical protein A1O5_02622 [Cladophialophora psammophila CBS 110553]